MAIMGESGSGKTTLLNILAALDQPTGGQVMLDGRDLAAVREKELAAFRRDNLGFVFQDFNLLDTFSLRDNILLPLVLAGKPYSEMERAPEPAGPEAGHCEAAGEVPLRGLRRPEAARRRGPGAHHAIPSSFWPTSPPARWTRKSTDELLRLFEAVNRQRADHRDGHPLRQGGQPCRPGAVHQGRRGVPPALPGQRHRRGALSEDQRHADRAGNGR